MKTVSLINPWSKVSVDVPVGEIVERIAAYCWPDEVRIALDGMCDTDEEWVERAIEMMGDEQAGIVIIGG